ncbi:MAG: hypothetical protein LBR78_01620 [Holosporales bacterium]|nr:hypothetical protein [Holosporales bacterium]
MNRAIMISLSLLTAVGLCVLRIKYEVVFLRKKLHDVERDIQKYQDDIRIYSAEWGCLNDPKRLKALCEKYLNGMRPMERSQIISYKKFAEGGGSVGTDYRGAFEKFLDESLDHKP